MRQLAAGHGCAGSAPDPLPKTAEFDMLETKILHKIILYCNFVILPAVNFKN